MALESKKEKKRKAEASSAQVDQPHKKTKKTKTSGDVDKAALGKNTTSSMSDGPAAGPHPASQVNQPVLKSKKDRKRAADYLGDDDEGEKVAITKSAGDENGEAPEKAKKKSKRDKHEDADPVLVVESRKKKKSSASDVPAEKIDRLVSTPHLEGEDKVKNKKARGGTKKTLTANGLNGVEENNGDENLGLTTANKNVELSLQAEAQRTVDHEIEEEFGSDDDDDDEADQAAAFLAGFDTDDEDTAKDEDVDPGVVAPLPHANKTKDKIRKALAKAKNDEPGTVYVGRVPHGFYEHQMRQYFSQFGDITKLRLSRNKRTGASKHYAFIEFESQEVAKIVASTMDNYLMFGHILKCKFAQPGSLHPDIWKGANKRYRKIPHVKLEKAQLQSPKTTEKWARKAAKEQKKREEKAEQMKKLGYEYTLPKMQAPAAALADQQLQIDAPSAVKEPNDLPAAIEAPNGADVEVDAGEPSQMPKKEKKKGKKSHKQNDVEDKPAVPETVAAAITPVITPAAPAVPVSTAAATAAVPVTGDEVSKKKKKGKKDRTIAEPGGGVLLPKDPEPLPTAVAPRDRVAPISEKPNEKPSSAKKRKSDVKIGLQEESITKKPKKEKRGSTAAV